MATATDPSSIPNDARWLNNQAPGWLKPVAASLALVEGSLLLGQAGLIALVLGRVLTAQAALAEQTAPMIGLIAIVIARSLVHAVRSSLAERASAQIRQRLRDQLFRRLCRSDPAHGADFETGALAHQLVDRVDKLDPYFSRFLPQQFSALLIPLLIVLAVSWINWLAGLLLAIAAPIIPAFMALIGIGAERLSRDQATVTARLSGLFHDRLRGLSAIQRFGASDRVIDWLTTAAQDYRERTMKVLRLAFLSSAVLEFFAAVAIASLAIYIGLSLLGFMEIGPSEQLGLASGLFILLLAPDFFLALRQLAQHWHDRADALAAAHDLRPLFQRPVIAQAIAHRSPRPGPGNQALSVEIDDLAFSYPAGPTLFEHLSLEIKPGERLLINGASGSGKSSLLMLLAGLTRPDAGRILYQRRDISQWNDRELSEQRAWMGQNSVMFDKSLRENLTLGRSQFSDASLLEILELCGLGRLTDQLEHGLDTQLGNNGSRLSGGQARRVALARTLLQPRPLLLLDEPSEHLDPDSEAALWAAVEHCADRQPMTVVAVSHREAAKHWSSRIITLDHGIIQSGERR